MKNEAEVISGRYKTWLGAVVLLVAVCLILFTVFSTNQLGRSGATLLVDRVSSLVLPAGQVSAFQLIDGDERPFTAHNLVDRWTFIVFGFTSCPDVCPSTLAVLTEFRETLTREFEGAKDVNIILVTVDPERDTPAILKQYVQHFDQHFIGLSGTDAQIRNLANQLGASYEITNRDASTGYTVSHSASLYLIDPQARHYATYVAPLEAALIAQRFKVFKQLYSQVKDGR
ncbi:MAG: SCO family protein [Zwartia sp.]